MNEILPQHDIVLLGAGHTNAHIIRMWRMRPIPNTRLTCVSDHLTATYSGMLAGTLAGQYKSDDMTIDLVRLCASCGVRLIHAQAEGLDLTNQKLLLSDRNAVPFDLLSIGIGSRPSIPSNGHGGLSIKPMQTFLNRLRQAIEARLTKKADDDVHFAIIGGGAAGVEIICCLQEFVKKEFSIIRKAKFTLIESGRAVLQGMPRRSQQLANDELSRRDIALRLASRVKQFDGNLLEFADGSELPTDIVVWATSAQPSPLLEQLDLPLDERGFLQTRNTLQSTGADNIFAVGDAGTVEGTQYAKAGVYAVRQGPTLWNNLQRKLTGQPLESWTPQWKFLSLIGTGDDRAILTYHGLSLHNRWCWKLKDWIDTRFLAKYQQYEPPMMMSSRSAIDDLDLAKQCGGCGSKASARVLQNSVPKVAQREYEHVLMGLEAPDDVALIANSQQRATAVTTDFFSAFVDEPYLMGRIAAQNALSDLYAKNATPRAALSVAILPHGPEHQQSQLLEDVLAGAAKEFSAADVAIVGGHSIVGAKLTVGFTILGDADPNKVPAKSAVVPGDVLLLTKPLGTGVLLAAQMQAACRADWWQELVESMVRSNRAAAELAGQLHISAATDVTGFGLAGHLSEMLTSTGLACELSLRSLPTLPGARELLRRGFESTLAPSNREAVEELLRFAPEADPTKAAILFDPQTSGGLLLATPQENVESLQTRLGTQAAVIGKVVPATSEKPEIRLLE